MLAHGHGNGTPRRKDQLEDKNTSGIMISSCSENRQTYYSEINWTLKQ